MKFTIAQKKSVIVLSRHIDRWDFTTPDNNSKKKKDANILLLIIHDNNNQREGKAPNRFSMLIMFVSPLKFTPRKEMYMLPRSTITKKRNLHVAPINHTVSQPQFLLVVTISFNVATQLHYKPQGYRAFYKQLISSPNFHK